MNPATTADLPAKDTKESALDWLFERLGSSRVPARPPSNAPKIEEDVGDPATVSAVPEIRSSADLGRAAEWLERERRRLEAYTHSQLGRIRQEHQALVEQKYITEQTLIARSQEVTRQEQFIVARTKELETTGEGGIGGAALAEAMEQHQQARAREEADWQTRRAQLDERFAEAARAELAAEQRLAELDDLEARLLHEAEQRELALRQQENSLVEWQGQLEELADTLEDHARQTGNLDRLR